MTINTLYAFLDAIAPMIYFVAVAGTAYLMLGLIARYLRRREDRDRERRVKNYLKRLQKSHRRRMSRTHPTMKPWVNQSTGRLHDTVR